ncbi:cilia- and flagella-associated protein 161-like isoform X2 [Centruroides sculpturatus]|uniref:cilia- and flagella-associated protein 161-like isoform X2 n=1 Tax=Centruroides sculpturatus TaxID=218467 RepID=UPI000C6D8F27|nr:cilia- and flagella-associated protein 161-like isoform X2 [Centruroides sculpturatus]
MLVHSRTKKKHHFLKFLKFHQRSQIEELSTRRQFVWLSKINQKSFNTDKVNVNTRILSETFRFSTEVETRPYVKRYNPYCLISNWNEDIHLAEAKLEEYLKRKEEGSLLVQRINRILNSALTPVNLTPAKEDGYVRDGSVVSIKSCAVDHAYLAASPHVPDHEGKECDEFASPCSVTATYYSSPCRRNVFVIRKVPEITRYGLPFRAKVEESEPILFGEKVTFSNLDTCGGLMLYSDLNDAVRYASKSKHQEVSLTNQRSEKLYWKILPRDPTFGLELEGWPVPANGEVVINHAHTNRHLALEKYRVRRCQSPLVPL